MQKIIRKKHATRKKASPGRPRSTAIDSAILRAVLEVFVERGLDGVGIEQVAERAGVARTTVYRRWVSRESIIAEAIEQERGEAEEEILRNPISARATVKGIVEALAQTVGSTDYRRMVARLIGSIPDCPQLMAVYWQTYLVPRRKVAAKALELARARGLIGQDRDAEILLDIIGGAIMYRLLVNPSGQSELDVRSYLLKLMGELGLSG